MTPRLDPRQAAWCHAVEEITRFSGVTTADRPTMDDVWFAAVRLGVTVDELLEAARLRVRYCLGTVQN